MESQEKSVNQFAKELRAAGLDFEFKATNIEGLTVKSKGWIEDETVYTEISPVLEYKVDKNVTKTRKR